MTERSRRLAVALVAGAGAVATWASGEIGPIVVAIASAAALLAYLLSGAGTPLRVEAPAAAASPAADSVGIEALADPALVIDRGSRIAAANAAARRMIGERAIGDVLSIALRHPVALEAVRLARDQGGAVEREVAGVGRQDGLYRLRAVGIDEGRLLLTFSDISAARLAERMRVDFVANASHELRTPLATILGFIETLQGPAAGDAAARQRFLDIMGREASRMTRLIDDLLSLSRIELDKYVRPTTPITLAPLIGEVARSLAMRLEADQRTLAIEVADGLPPVIGDRDQILQVLHNLVSNALKYGRSGTPIRLAAEQIDRPQPVVRVSVIDEGEGIAKEHLPRLTERFYRVDNSRSRSLGGTGLGLAIVKHIVERHRGQLVIDSTEGVGTAISFTLPHAVDETMSQK